MPASEPPAPTIHIVDDDRDHRELIRASVQDAGYAGESVHEHLATDTLDPLLADTRTVHVILLDLCLGDHRALEILPALRSRYAGPILILTGNGDEKSAAQCIKLGASDYLVKAQAISDPSGLRAAIESAVELYRGQQQSELETAELQRRSARLADLCEMSQTFVDSVSHEFRTPLAVLKEFNALLVEEIAGPLNETQHEYLEIMACKINDLTIMVNDLLDSSRIQAGLLGVSRRPCSVGEIIDSVHVALERQAHTSNVALKVDSPDDLPEVYCDPEKMARIIINLAINGMKFSPEGSAVDIVAQKDPSEPFVNVTIVDRGPGIAPDDVEAIFERFKQVGACRNACKGFGLGLSIVRDLLRLNMCDVDVQSELGKGSTFRVRVPQFDRDRIIHHFLDHAQRLGATGRSVAVVEGRIGAAQGEDLEDSVTVINHSLQPAELFIRLPNAKNFVILTPMRSAAELIDAINVAVGLEFQGMMADRMPQLHCSTLGLWDTAEKRQYIIAACRDQLEPAHEVPAHV